MNVGQQYIYNIFSFTKPIHLPPPRIIKTPNYFLSSPKWASYATKLIIVAQQTAQQQHRTIKTGIKI